MLCTYGNCVTLIDATYKTMRYDLPLFFVCVRTNIGYCVAAEFITQSETAEAIQKPLQVLKTGIPTGIHLLFYVIIILKQKSLL